MFQRFDRTLAAIFRSKIYVAHHGLQRNGTNFLLLSLKKCGLTVVNEIDPDRNQIQHKHFRWYADKKNIPKLLNFEYGNNVTVGSVHQLNNKCKYPNETKHVVIYKEPDSALVSMLNWGLRCKWFVTKKDALAASDQFRADYDAYFEFWRRLAEMDPDFVQLIKYESLMSSEAVLFDCLNKLNIKPRVTDANFEFTQVPQSPISRKEIVSLEDLRK